jgi:hypothetical protein
MYGVTVGYDDTAIESNAQMLASVQKTSDNLLSTANVVVEGG